MIAVWLFLKMPRVCLQFVIVVFPDHTHQLFFGMTHCTCIYREAIGYDSQMKIAFLSLKIAFVLVNSVDPDSGILSRYSLFAKVHI